MLGAIDEDTQCDDVDDLFDRLDSLIERGGVPTHVHEAYIDFSGAVYAAKGCMFYAIEELTRLIAALEEQ